MSSNSTRVYSLWSKSNSTPDKIVKYKSKLPDGKKIIHKLPLYKKVDKEYVIGYLTPESMLSAREDEKNLLLLEDVNECFLWVKDEKKKTHRIIGYVRVNEFEYIGVTASLLFLLILFLVLVGLSVVLILMLKLSPGEVKLTGDKEDVIISDSTIDMDDIPDFKDESEEKEQEMAYISGNSITPVSASYPYVYLLNDKVNEKYTLVYEVYVGDYEECVFKTNHIVAGSAEPWNAYECDKIVMGENDITYEVFIYDADGVNVAQTTLNGLTVIKK